MLIIESNSSGAISAGSSGTASLPANSGGTWYLRGVTVTSLPAVALVGGTVTISGVAGGPLLYEYAITVTSGGLLQLVFFGDSFFPGLAASASQGAITVTLSAITGGSTSAISMWGVLQ